LSDSERGDANGDEQGDDEERQSAHGSLQVKRNRTETGDLIDVTREGAAGQAVFESAPAQVAWRLVAVGRRLAPGAWRPDHGTRVLAWWQQGAA
jgi:hypothetical protein